MNIPKKKILFLYYELAGYFVASLRKLVTLYPVECHVIRQPVNQIAPFEIEGHENIFFHNRNDYDYKNLIALINELNPAVIICSGWADRDYVKTCKHFKGKISTVVGFDNPWRNTLKQNIGSFVGRAILPKIFDHCWVAGNPQWIYAKKLGFADKKITGAYYCCDYDLFQNYFNQTFEHKRKHFPKRILYVGRYTKLKGTRELWKAFQQFQDENPCEWELWCLGKGEYDNEFPKHDKIKNFGFVQPSKLGDFIKQTGVFILPAHYEHWGVVVHEFATAGFPLVCTTSTSAAQLFLQEGINGFFHKPQDIQSMVDVFKKMASLTDEQLFEMGKRSNEMSQKITPDLWSKNVWNFTDGNKT